MKDVYKRQELNRSERATIRKLVTELCANYDSQDKICLPLDLSLIHIDVYKRQAYGMEIEDKRTVYGECTYRLVPREDEPSVCLMHDWIDVYKRQGPTCT